MVHRLDTLSQLLCRLFGLVNLHEISIHLVEVLINELIDDLGRQVNPNVENSVLILSLEGFEEVLLDVGDDGVGAPKVQLVPCTVSLAVVDALLADGPVGEQMVDELN